MRSSCGVPREKNSASLAWRGLVLLSALLSGLTGCTWFAYTNTKAGGQVPRSERVVKAAFVIGEDRGAKRNGKKSLVILALSGGGSRAAYWSGSVMLKLADIFRAEGLNLLKEVDVISSVSGGSLPAAYYAISRTPDEAADRAV